MSEDKDKCPCPESEEQVSGELVEFLMKILIEHGTGKFKRSFKVPATFNYPSDCEWKRINSTDIFVHIFEKKTGLILVKYFSSTNRYQLTPRALEIIQKGESK